MTDARICWNEDQEVTSNRDAMKASGKTPKPTMIRTVLDQGLVG